MRNYNSVDQILSHLDRGLRTIFVKPNIKAKDYPGNNAKYNSDMDKADRKRSARLMRVNHSGEIAAQGLYHGHATTAKDEKSRSHMNTSANEEKLHLGWCEKRLYELDDRPSALTPVWYLGSYTLGAAVGLLGDKWSLGFISETEKQVVEHLDKHLEHLPEQDKKSREILLNIRSDEAKHDKSAQAAGATELPTLAKVLMNGISKVMTKTSYWV